MAGGVVGAFGVGVGGCFVEEEGGVHFLFPCFFLLLLSSCVGVGWYVVLLIYNHSLYIYGGVIRRANYIIPCVLACCRQDHRDNLDSGSASTYIRHQLTLKFQRLNL